MGYIQLVRRSAEQKPGSQSVKEELKPVRYYPDKTIIPGELPLLYEPADPNPVPGAIIKRCDNCLVWIESSKYCKRWNAVVRPEYVCAAWQAVA